MEAFDEEDSIILRLSPPRTLIGTVIEMGEKKGAIGSDLFIHPAPLKTGYRIELTESSAMEVTPVVENPDVDADPSEAYLDRTLLEQQLYGGYYFFPDWGFFRIAVNVGGLPADYFSHRRKLSFLPKT